MNRHEYDEVYVISDLHIGGRKDFQIFDQGAALEAFLNRLSEIPAAKRVALIINGDMVDFLAEEPARYLDPRGANAKLDRLFADPAFVPVWRGLKKFAGTDGRTLVITLGNHDLELALPWVRDHLVDALSGGSEQARARIYTSLDGSGYRCTVNGRSVVCLHGNEVDGWNITDHERLRMVGVAGQCGKEPEAWRPNAGTKLVVDVMNEIKADYRFVDLLKPENEAVVPTLLALKPEHGPSAREVFGIVGRKVQTSLGFLGAEAAEEKAAAPSGQQQFDTLMTRTFQKQQVAANPLDMLLNAEGSTPRPSGETEFLGVGSAIVGLFTGRKTEVVLRDALEGLVNNAQTFGLNVEDDTYKGLEQWAAASIDFLIAGHTHLERVVDRPGGGVYYNSGTWVCLMKLDKKQLETDDAFTEVWRAIQGRTLAALEKVDGLIHRYNTVVRIAAGDDGRVQADLRHVDTKTFAETVVADSARER